MHYYINEYLSPPRPCSAAQSIWSRVQGKGVGWLQYLEAFCPSLDMSGCGLVCV